MTTSRSRQQNIHFISSSPTIAIFKRAACVEADHPVLNCTETDVQCKLKLLAATRLNCKSSSTLANNHYYSASNQNKIVRQIHPYYINHPSNQTSSLRKNEHPHITAQLENASVGIPIGSDSHTINNLRI